MKFKLSIFRFLKNKREIWVLNKEYLILDSPEKNYLS